MEEKQVNKKRKKRLSFYQQAKKQAKKGRFGQGNQIDEDTYQYFIRVMEINRDDFDSKEDRDVFVNNVFAQIEGQEVNCSCNQLASRVIEKLLPSVSDEVLEKLMTVFFKEIRPLCCNQFASHVLQTLVITASERGMTIYHNKPSDSIDCEIEAGNEPKFITWVLQVSRFMMNNLEDFVWDTYANHVIRTCLECLSGFPAGTITMQRQKGKTNKTEFVQPNREVPPAYKQLVVEYGKRLKVWPQLAELAYDNLTSGLLQTLLHALNAVDKKWTKKLVKKLLIKCFMKDDGKEDKEQISNSSELPALFYSEPALRLMEVTIAVASTKQFTQLYAFCFNGRLIALSKEPFANFTVQRLFSHCQCKEEFEAMFDEIADGFESILASGNTGVLVSVAQGCLRNSTRQNHFIKNLMQALHCNEPETRQDSLGYLIARLATYEEWSANKETFSVSHNGSVLLQTLLKFSKPIKIVNCLMSMNSNELKSLFCDPKGSYVMDAFVAGEYVGEKSRERMIRKLQGTYVALACSKHGSRSVDAIWAAANLKQKLVIMEELAPKEAILNSNQFGQILCSKYGISLFRHRRDDWKDVQGKEQRTKALFADIIGDVGKKKK